MPLVEDKAAVSMGFRVPFEGKLLKQAEKNLTYRSVGQEFRNSIFATRSYNKVECANLRNLIFLLSKIYKWHLYREQNFIDPSKGK